MILGGTLACVLAAPAGAAAQALKDLHTPGAPLVLKAQGSFFVGGEKAEQTAVELGDLGPGGPYGQPRPGHGRHGPPLEGDMHRLTVTLAAMTVIAQSLGR